MVGVPGRSKACSTCRKRKKGCDRKRPVCSQCSAVGLECGSYERERVFLNHSQDTEAGSVHVVYRKELAGKSHNLSGVTDIVLPRELTRSAYVEKYIGIFLSKFLPGGRSLPTGSSDYTHTWVKIAHDLHTSDKAIQLSLTSLGLFAVGESRLALQCYSYALHMLQIALCSPYRPPDDSTLAACKIFSLFEMFHGDDGDALSQGIKWLSHLNGQLAIVKARSPYEYQTGVSHQLFTDGRYPLLISSIKDRTRFPLNTPEWRTIPWQQQPKSHKDKLEDILADLTEVLVDTDQMHCCEDIVEKANRRREIVKACQDLNQSLQHWVREAGPLKDFHDSNGLLIDRSDLCDIPLAHLTVIYWTTCVILYSTLISVYGPSLSEIPASIDPKPYIQKVLRALPFFWQPGAGTSSASMAAFPLGTCMNIAYAAPDHFQEECAIADGLVSRPDIKGTIIKFLYSLHKGAAKPELAQIEGKQGIALRARSWMMGKQ
ncbi:hypothetical protein F5Y19DRAFT_422696 [Xylariaceae sp. FL1651]|nr:hypothetical protein F5Y19DRAFT_422696 [Xylariaceae sp. FL1651]